MTQDSGHIWHVKLREKSRKPLRSYSEGAEEELVGDPWFRETLATHDSSIWWCYGRYRRVSSCDSIKENANLFTFHIINAQKKREFTCFQQRFKQTMILLLDKRSQSDFSKEDQVASASLGQFLFVQLGLGRCSGTRRPATSSKSLQHKQSCGFFIQYTKLYVINLFPSRKICINLFRKSTTIERIKGSNCEIWCVHHSLLMWNLKKRALKWRKSSFWKLKSKQKYDKS